MRRFLVLLLPIIVAACAPDDGPAAVPDPSAEALVWPQPPERARIRYLYSFGEPEQLGIRPGFFSRLWSLIAGKENRRMLRPYAVAVAGPRIAVADPGLQAVHLFDTDKASYRRVQKLGDEILVSPVGVALAGDRVYVADSVLDKVFAVGTDGKLLATIENLERPTGLAYDAASRRLYVAETLGHRISTFDEGGRRVARFGVRGSAVETFNYPTHLTVDDGRLHINDTMNFRLQTFDLSGRFISSFGRHGDGSGNFAQPKGVATDSQGHLYVADSIFNRVQIFDLDGRFLLAFGGDGDKPGEFALPAGLFIAEDRIYVADSYNRRIQVFEFLGDG